jgi:hypothetical protein
MEVKMKKIFTLLLISIFVGSFIPAYAQEMNDTDADVENALQEPLNPGITPDKRGYGLKIALEKIRLALIFNKEKRAELELKLAEKRLEEAKLMAKENKLDALQRANKEHKQLLEKARSDLKEVGENEADLEKQSKIELELENQENKAEDLENIILLKAQGLTDEQRQKLLDLISSFKNETSSLKVKVLEDKQALVTKLRERGVNETKLDEKAIRLGEDAEKLANQEIEQSKKMFDLASKLIEKAQANKNLTLKQETLDSKTKAESKLNEAKQALVNEEFRKVVELARESKKLSTLTIASIQGLSKGLIKEKINELEEKARIVKEKINMPKKVKEEPCVKEGRDLGPVIPGNEKNCCEGLKPYVKPNILGTRGICVKGSEENNTSD